MKNQKILYEIDSLFNRYQEGEFHLYDCLIAFRELKDRITEISEEINQAVLNNIGIQPVNWHGYEITRQARRRWSFDNVTAYKHAQESLKKIQALAKQAAEMKTPLILEETGEIIEEAEVVFQNCLIVKKLEKENVAQN